MTARDGALTELTFGASSGPVAGGSDDVVLAATAEQLQAYFAGALTAFDVTCAPAGTPFQRAVWEALRAIPYGRTTTYGEVATTIGRPDAVRAVGAANGQNPIAIIVPCHRVIGADGSLTGYGGGLDVKHALLELEGVSLGRHRAAGQPLLPLDFA